MQKILLARRAHPRAVTCMHSRFRITSPSVSCRLPFRKLKNSPLHIRMGEQLRTSTQEKQTCAICLQTIRKNAVWWHVTECKHYFHYDCWHSYRKHECDRREGTHTRVKCPACRHPQVSEAEFMAVMVPLMERALGSRQGAGCEH